MLAGIRGDERAGYDLARALGGHLKTQAGALEGRRVVILPELNPDGIRTRTAFNANGKDINRDFKAKSQPETIALLAILRCYKPEWIIALRDFEQIDYDPSPRSPSPSVRSVGRLAQAIAREIGARAAGLSVKRMFAGRNPAEDSTLGLYSGNVLKIPVVSVGLHSDAKGMSARALWHRYKEPLLAGIQFRPSPEMARPPIALPSLPAQETVSSPSNPSTAEKTANQTGVRTAPPVEETPSNEISGEDVLSVPESPEESSPMEAPSDRDSSGRDLSRPEQDGPDLERAISLFEAGRYPEARGAFEAFSDCEACPRWIEKSVAAKQAAESARAARSDRNWLGLATSSQALLRLNPQDPQAGEWRDLAFEGLLDISREDFRAGRYAAAGELFAPLESLAECPECETLAEEARNALEIRREGDTAMDEGRLSEAEVFFQSLIAINPADENAQARLAAIEERRQTNGRASELLDAGKAFCDAGNWRDGIPSLEESLALKPDCESCRTALESCLDARDEHFYRSGLTKFQGEDTAGAITDWARVRSGYKVVDDLLKRACQLLAGKGEEHPACGS
ncbi:MAG: hypothetical protein ACLFN9_06435 [Desulfococcaceae bacterium]